VQQEVYPDTVSDLVKVPEGYKEVKADVADDEISYRLVASLYEREGMDLRKEKMAIRMNNMDLALIDPGEKIPVSPMTGGAPPWLVKAYVTAGDIWDLIKEGTDMSELRQKISDALIETVSTGYDSKESFTKAASENITRAIGIMGDFVEIDVIDQEK